jgi:hypothetical protein
MLTAFKLSARVSPAMVRTLATSVNQCALPALCQANSEVLSRIISVIDTLIKKKSIAGANQVFNTECLDTTMGKQVRHSLDHLEKVALQGLSTVRDNSTPIDLHYDVRERGTFCERDVCEARDRALFIQNVFDGVYANAQKEGVDLCTTDGIRPLTAYFSLPGTEMEEIPVHSTLEREMSFVCHHAVHHNTLIKAIAAIGSTGLTPDDLPPDFGRSPTGLVRDVSDDQAA